MMKQSEAGVRQYDSMLVAGVDHYVVVRRACRRGDERH